MARTSADLDNQGLKNRGITKKNYALTIVFFVIDWNGMDWRFLNNLDERHDFAREYGYKWGQFTKHMQPGTFHAFLMKSWLSDGEKTKSGQNFWPVAHVAQMESLEEARMLNAQYLRHYTSHIQDADAKTSRLQTFAWARKLKEFMLAKRGATIFLAEQCAEIFNDAEYEAAYKSAMEALTFNPNWDEIIDNTEGHPFYEELRDFCSQHTIIDERGFFRIDISSFADQVEGYSSENFVEE